MGDKKCFLAFVSEFMRLCQKKFPYIKVKERSGICNFYIKLFFYRWYTLARKRIRKRLTPSAHLLPV